MSGFQKTPLMHMTCMLILTCERGFDQIGKQRLQLNAGSVTSVPVLRYAGTKVKYVTTTVTMANLHLNTRC